jgi:flagellin-specific chaperone FliS
MLSRLHSVSVRCNKQDSNPISDARKRFEKRRNTIAKENFNKIVNIVNADLKDSQEFLTELDKLHRIEFDKLVNKNKENDVTVVTPSEVIDDDNIFANS